MRGNLNSKNIFVFLPLYERKTFCKFRTCNINIKRIFQYFLSLHLIAAYIVFFSVIVYNLFNGVKDVFFHFVYITLHATMAKVWINYCLFYIVNAECLRKVYIRPSGGSVLGQRRRWLTGIKPAMGCAAGPTSNRNLVGRPTFSVRGTS